jgi:hypothetical protein
MLKLELDIVCGIVIKSKVSMLIDTCVLLMYERSGKIKICIKLEEVLILK